MTIKQFIEKAIEGGWEATRTFNRYEEGYKRLVLDPKEDGEPDLKLRRLRKYMQIEEVLLDPAFWRALGKVEGWEEHDAGLEYPIEWKNNMHRMIDALAEGKTIEQYLEML